MRTSWINVAPIVVISALSGCVSPQVVAARQAAEDNAECVSLGFKPGTEAFGNCRLQLRSIRAMEALTDAAREAAMTPPSWNWPYMRPLLPR